MCSDSFGCEQIAQSKKSWESEKGLDKKWHPIENRSRACLCLPPKDNYVPPLRIPVKVCEENRWAKKQP
jgi:hypothetical protein